MPELDDHPNTSLKNPLPVDENIHRTSVQQNRGSVMSSTSQDGVQISNTRPQQNEPPESPTSTTTPNPNPNPNRSATPTLTVPYLRLFTFADTFDRILIVLGTLGAMGAGLTFPFMTILFGQVIDAFGQNAAYSDRVQREVAKVSLLFVYLGMGALVTSFIEVTCWMVSGERQASRIRGLYLQAMLRQDVTFFDTETSTGEVIGRISGDTILVHEAIGEKVGQFIQYLATFVGGFLVAFIKGWKLTLVLLVAIPFMIVVGAALSVLISKATSKGQEAYAQAGAVVEQAISAIRTVAAFTGERKALEAYKRRLKATYKAFVLQGFSSGLGLGAFMLTFFSTYALAIYYGSKLIVNEGYTGGNILNVLLAILIGSMSLGQASPSVSAFASGKAAAYKMFQVIHRVPEIDIYDMKGDVLEDVRGDIEFVNVDFSYPTRPEVKIFSKFSIHIAHGTTVALVGESGSGKSTVISLIERFYDPQGGTILLDGIDIKLLQLKWFRNQIGLVGQEPVLFGTSIKDNIAYGKDNATLEEIQQAAVLANASTFISQLPEGFDTLVGEHGTQLSGGQKQRIAIARAILKNPHILLLDEATSALDAESERLVQDALDRVMMGRTTMIIAHRLTTIRNVDMIAVVQSGTVVETGKHGELLQDSTGAYSQLIKLQQMQQQEENEQEDAADEPKRSSSLRSLRKAEQSGSFRFIIRRSFSKISDSNRSQHSESKQEHARTSPQRKKGVGLFGWCGGKPEEEDPESADGLKNVNPNVSILRLASLNKSEAHILFLGSIAAIGNGVIFPIYGLLLSTIIKIFFEPPDKLRKDADFWAIIFLVFGCSAFVILTIQMLCFAIAGGRLVERVRCLTFEKVLQQETAWFDERQNSSGAVSARLSADATHVKTIVGDTLALIVRNLATIVASLVIAFSANWILALVILAVVPLLGLEGFVRVKFMKGFSADAKVMYEEASQVASDAVGSIRTVASFCAEGKVLDLYHDKCKFPLRKGIHQGFLSGTAFGFSNFVMYAAYALCFWFGAKLVQQGKADFEQVFKVFFAITMGAMSISQSTIMLGDVTNAKAAVNSVFALLDRQSKINPFDNSGITPTSIIGKIEFHHVNFRYPTRPNIQILKDFCLSVRAGKTVALVGESGCGKSTVISLLERFYDPETGQILLDGIDIKKLQVRWLRQQIGLVGQEPILFNTTIRENIIYGLNGGIASEEEIIAAAQAANAHKFIMELPEGYNTSVGERGIQLSGGQKQRVAIARAIIRDPKILLLDEATSALDAESEHIVQEALERVMIDRSVIVIAHRLSTIKNANLIAVVKEGVVIEQGRHDELLHSKEGEYASLVKLHMGS